MISRICPTSLRPSLILIQNDGSQFIAGVRHLLTTGNIGTYSCIYMGGTTFTTMKPKKKQKKLLITEKDFLLANRRAARMAFRSGFSIQNTQSAHALGISIPGVAAARAPAIAAMVSASVASDTALRTASSSGPRRQRTVVELKMMPLYCFIPIVYRMEL